MIIEQIRSARPGASVSVTTANIQVVGYRKNRFVAMIQNTHASVAIRVGSAAELTASRGIVVPAGGIYTHYGSGALMAIAASGTVTVNVVDLVGPVNHADAPRESVKTVTSARQKILSRDHKRQFVTLYNADGTDTVFLGGHAGVLPDTADLRLAPGASITIPGGAAWWAMTDGTNEVQTLTITGSPTGGTYTLSYGGHVVTVPYNADATAIQTALRTNPLLAPDSVAVTGTGPFTITFDKALGGRNVDAIVASGAGLTGGTTPAAAITTATPGVSQSAEVRMREERRS